MHKCISNEENSSSKILFKGKYYDLIECKICGFLQTRLSEPTINNIYESGHYKLKPYFIIPFLINLLDYILNYFILINRSIKHNSFILDFGCGKGYFLYFLKLLKFNHLFGIETSISRANYASTLTNLNITSDEYSKEKIMNVKFDCITLIHVLEHIERPFDLLNLLINDSLEKNGALLIEVPNINSTASRLAGKTWAHFTPHFHINHFTSQSLNNFCETNNLKYELVSTFSIYNSAMGMTSALLSLLGYNGRLFEDAKNKKAQVIIPFILFFPLTISLECIISLLFKKGSVIKCIIKKGKNSY